MEELLLHLEERIKYLEGKIKTYNELNVNTEYSNDIGEINSAYYHGLKVGYENELDFLKYELRRFF